MELESDDETRGRTGLALGAGGRRFVSDPLIFTGTDLGDGAWGSRQRTKYRFQDDDGGDLSDEDGPMAEDKERALLASAWAQIRRAKEQGHADVDLSLAELNALDRQKKRMQMEERRRRQESQQRRVVVALSELDLPGAVDSERSLPHDFEERQDGGGYPPIGYFPPPSGPPNTRARSGARSSLNLERDGRDMLAYPQISPPGQPPRRHVSDTMPMGSRSGLPDEEDWGRAPYYLQAASTSAPLIPAGARPAVDPYLYMTSGTRPPYASSTVPARQVSMPPDPHARAYVPYPLGAGNQDASIIQVVPSADDDDDDDDDTEEVTCDDTTDSGSLELGEGTRTSRPGSGLSPPITRGRARGASIASDLPERELRPRPAARARSTQRSTKRSANVSPAKKKSVGAESRKKKGK